MPPESGLPLRERLERAATSLGASEPEAWGAVLELLSPVLERCGDDLSRFLAELACTTEIDTWDPRAARVALLTLHASKGLEFECVFIPGCEDGILPLRFGPRTGADAELDADGEGALEAAQAEEAEERRLFFVGMTRARRRLFLTSARSRLWLGQLRRLPPSPFLEALPPTWLESSRAVDGGRAPARQLELF